MTIESDTSARGPWARRAQDAVAALPKAVIFAISLTAMAGVFAIDLVTGGELSVSIFFLIPVGFTAWFVNRPATIAVAFSSATLWYVGEGLGGRAYSNPLIPVWNATVRLGFFLIVASLLFVVRDALSRLEDLARRDPLTGLANLRHFSSIAEQEGYRARRYEHPISVAYLDLDNFKGVNDRFGHERGDILLRTVAATIAANIRESDTLGRLGGDEFALLMPETPAEAAVAVVTKLQSALRVAMAEADLGVTVSAGCVTYSQPPESVDELIAEADSLMYEAKRAGKDTIIHRLH